MLTTLFSRAANTGFNISPAAAVQVKKLLEGDCENRMMRVGLKSGGCAGFKYDFDFESRPKDGDHVFLQDGASVVLDNRAMLYLRGGTLDYVSTKFSSSFKVRLPESTELHNCGCGNSVGTEHNPDACGT